MFFKPNTLIYLQRNSLMVAGKHVTAARLEFPEDIVKNLEVLQRPRLVELIRQFLQDHNLHGRRILIVLDSSVIFQKVIELDKSGQPDVLIEGFVEAMPFEPGQRVCLAVQTDSHLRLFATNAALYEATVEALDTSGAGTLVAITPSGAYTLSDEDRNVSAAAEKFFANTKIRKFANFHAVTPV